MVPVTVMETLMLVVVAVKLVLQAVIMPVVQHSRMMNVVYVMVTIAHVLTVQVYQMVLQQKMNAVYVMVLVQMLDMIVMATV